MDTSKALNDPLSEQELYELEAFLISERTGNAMSLDALDGFFTALVIGPTTVMPGEWLPCVLGTEDDKSAPAFSSAEEFQRIMLLLVRYMNSLAVIFRNDPDSFMPIFDLSSYESKEEEEWAVSTWAKAFMYAMELCYDDWEPIFGLENEEGGEGEESALFLGPIFLLAGHEENSRELKVSERKILREMVAESVGDIYRFWLPYRGVAPEKPSSKKGKIISLGRNDPCPCGSGKKYKNCCGT